MNSLVEENYLKALFTLSEGKGEVNVNDLSRHLDIKMPTVTSMMKKLASKNLVYYERYKPLKLTGKGLKEAALIIRKHRLTEMYLVEKMGFGWEEVHGIAEQMEHIKSPKFFAKMDELLNYPKIDPHGSPIPDKNGNVVWQNFIKLSECKPKDSVLLAAVIDTSSEFLQFLNSREMSLGLKVNIISVEPFDNSMTINYKNRKAEVLSEKVSSGLLVQKI